MASILNTRSLVGSPGAFGPRPCDEKYGAASRAQMLKYHIQTSVAAPCTLKKSTSTISAPRCRHCMRYTTTATHCTPTPSTRPSPHPLRHSVRRAMAIQLIINRELGLAKNENPLQGAFIIEDFHRSGRRSRVDGIRPHHRTRRCARRHGNHVPAFSRIQEESLHYETLKHTGEFPIIGVNTFLCQGRLPHPRARRGDPR